MQSPRAEFGSSQWAKPLHQSNTDDTYLPQLNVLPWWSTIHVKRLTVLLFGKHESAVVFCDERLPDGSYRDLLASMPSSPQMNRFIVVQCTGEWEEFLEALRLGAAEVLRAPLQAPDIDIALFHAMRQGRENQAMAAEA